MDPSSLQIIHYPHPTLRYESKPIVRVDDTLRRAIEQMFPLMYEARGIGLAANQVDLPLRLFVLNLAADPNEGEELVFLNPVVSQPKGLDEKEEGCLSIPGVNAQVKRPEKIRIQAYNLEGKLLDATVDGLLARAIQHEVDHLDGVLFTDRLTETGKMAVQPELEELEIAYQSKLDTGESPGEDVVLERLRTIESQYA